MGSFEFAIPPSLWASPTQKEEIFDQKLWLEDFQTLLNRISTPFKPGDKPFSNILRDRNSWQFLIHNPDLELFSPRIISTKSIDNIRELILLESNDIVTRIWNLYRHFVKSVFGQQEAELYSEYRLVAFSLNSYGCKEPFQDESSYEAWAILIAQWLSSKQLDCSRGCIFLLFLTIFYGDSFKSFQSHLLRKAQIVQFDNSVANEELESSWSLLRSKVPEQVIVPSPIFISKVATDKDFSKAVQQEWEDEETIEKLRQQLARTEGQFTTTEFTSTTNYYQMQKSLFFESPITISTTLLEAVNKKQSTRSSFIETNDEPIMVTPVQEEGKKEEEVDEFAGFSPLVSRTLLRAVRDNEKRTSRRQ